jgi:hypothetical protein
MLNRKIIREKLLKRSSEKANGMISLELASTAFILVVISIFSIDAVSLVFGADFCDRACKDCARAAGQMATPDDAVNAMNAAAATHPVDGVFVTKMYPELLLYQDYNNGSSGETPRYGTTPAYLGKNGPNNITPADHDDSDGTDPNNPEKTGSPGPYVLVRTTLYLRIPVILTFFNNRFFTGNVKNDPQLFQFQSSYTFPITNTYVPN